eukprot:COSAG02_NODE_3100_length_7376_cov_112.354267_6_plen_147_part_00
MPVQVTAESQASEMLVNAMLSDHTDRAAAQEIVDYALATVRRGVSAWQMVGGSRGEGCRGASMCVVESELLDISTFGDGFTPRVLLDQVVVAIPTTDRGNLSYLPAVINSVLQEVDRRRIFVMHAGDRARQHPVILVLTPGVISNP